MVMYKWDHQTSGVGAELAGASAEELVAFSDEAAAHTRRGELCFPVPQSWDWVLIQLVLLSWSSTLLNS